MSEIDEIKKGLESKSVVIGTELTMKKLRAGKLAKVFVTKNCPIDVKEEIRSAAGDVEVVELKIQNTDLGVSCKKPFPISVIGFLRGENK